MIHDAILVLVAAAVAQIPAVAAYIKSKIVAPVQAEVAKVEAAVKAKV
jgi:hypothetical protein